MLLLSDYLFAFNSKLRVALKKGLLQL